jgi:phage-related protein
MAEIASLFVRLGLKSQDFVKGIGGAYNRTKKLSRSLVSLKRVAVGAFIGWGITRVIGEFEQLSATQEKAEAGLVQAMKSMGVHTKEFEATLFDTASALQKMTTFGDESIMMGMKFLLTYKQIGTDVLPRAASVMTDIAALMGGDMRMAANMLGKAAMGLTGELRRAGITVERTTFESEGFVGVLREIESQVKGQAAAIRATKAGGLEAFGNIVDDVKEKFGLFTSTVKFNIATFVLPAINKLNDTLNKMRKSGNLEKWAKNVADSIINLGKRILMGTAKFVDSTQKILRIIWSELKFMWDGFKKLPSWVQTIGILGALMGGRKGTIILGSLLHLINTLANSYEGFNQVFQGNIKFTELAAMNAEELAEKLEKLEGASYGVVRGIIPAREELKNFANQNKTVETTVRTLIAELENLSKVPPIVPPPLKPIEPVGKKSDLSMFKQFQAFAQMLQGSGEQWKKIVSGSGDVFFSKVSAGGGSMLASAAGIAVMWGELIIQIANAIQALIELPGRVIDAISGLFNAIGNFAKDLVKSLDGLIDSVYNAVIGIGEIWKKLWPKLLKLGPELVRAFYRAIPDLIDAFVESIPIIIDTIIDEVPKITEEIIEMIPVIIQKIVDSIPKIIQAIVDRLPDIIKHFISRIPNIIDAVIEALPEIIEAIIEAIPDIIEEIIKSIPKIAEAFIKALIKQLSSFGGLFSGGGGGLFGSIGSLFSGGGGGLFGGLGGGLFGGLGGGLGKAIGSLFHQGGLVPEAHRGLFVGKLRQDERPVIAQTGEEILSRNDPRNVRNLGRGNDVHLHIHGIVTTNDVRSWLSDLLLDSTRYRVGIIYEQQDMATVGIDI